MNWPMIITCHNDEVRNQFPDSEWHVIDDEGTRQCGFCGSLHPEDLIKFLDMGWQLAGSDWKQGWCHKFYLYNGCVKAARWINLHIMDENFEVESKNYLLSVLTEHSGIRWYLDEFDIVHFDPPYPGFKKKIVLPKILPPNTIINTELKS